MEMESEKIPQNPRAVSFPRAVTANDQPQRPPPPSILDRFRALLKQREEEVRVSSDDDVALGTEEVVRLYEMLLAELTFNSKPIITDLTIIAGELREHGGGIADAICARIVELVQRRFFGQALMRRKYKFCSYWGKAEVKNFQSLGPRYRRFGCTLVPTEQKLPSLYLLDSIVKNIGREYVRHFSSRLPEVFCEAYRQVHPNLYPSMRHLFGTWSTVFPPSVLHKIETQLQFSPQVNNRSSNLSSVRASEPSRPTHGIHVNPKYVRQLEHPNLDNNVQHGKGVSSNLKMYGQRPVIGYDDYDSEQAEIVSSQAGTQRLHATGGMGRVANRTLPSSTSRLPRPLSPSTFGAERPLSAEAEGFSIGNSPLRFIEGASPSHPAFDYGLGRPSLGAEDTNEWRRKRFFDDKHNRFESSVAYSNGHGHQSPRALIDAYGEDRGKRIPSSRPLLIDNLDVNGVGSKGVSRSWQNTEEEEFDWEDMSPTLADRGRNTDFLPSAAPFQSDGGKPGYGLHKWPAQARTPFVDDSTTVTDDAAPILGSGRGLAGKLPRLQSERNQIPGSDHSHESWSTSHRLPQSALLPIAQIPDSDGQLIRPPSAASRMDSNAFGARSGVVPSSTGAWSSVSVYKSNPPPVRNSFRPQKQGLQQSLLLPEQFSGLENKEHGLMKQLPLPSQRASLDQQRQVFPPQFLPAREGQENFPPMPQHLTPAMNQGYTTQPMNLLPSNPASVMPFPNTLNSQLGMRPPLPPGPPPPRQMIPLPQAAGPLTSNQPPGSAFSGLISSLMAQGLISLSTQTSSQDSVVLEFNADLLKVRHESAINALYGDLPRQCTTCGLRFKCQEDHSSHMDWHVTKNRMSKSRKQKPSRKWFVSSSMWLSGAEALGTESVPGFLPTETTVEKKVDEEMAVPADEEQNACALCGEPFDDFFSDETEEWMYRGAVYMNAPSGLTGGMDRSLLGPIVHAKCRSESNVAPPEGFGQDEGGMSEDGSQKRRKRS